MKSAVYEERLGRWEVLYLPKITFIDISLDCHKYHVPNFLVRARKVPRIHQELIDKIHTAPAALHAECWWSPSVVTTWRCDNASSGCLLQNRGHPLGRAPPGHSFARIYSQSSVAQNRDPILEYLEMTYSVLGCTISAVTAVYLVELVKGPSEGS